MGPRSPEFFDEIAGAIADGESVDWNRLEGAPGVTPRELRVLRWLEESRCRPLSVGGGAGSWEGEAIDRGFETVEEIGRGSYGRV